MNGSSHDPKFDVVALKFRTWCTEVDFATVLRVGRSGVLRVILSPWKALRSDRACDFISAFGSHVLPSAGREFCHVLGGVEYLVSLDQGQYACHKTWSGPSAPGPLQVTRFAA